MVRIMQCAIRTRNHETTVSAEDTRYRHMTAYNTEKDSSALKIRRATQTQKPCCSVMQCIRSAFANIFVTNSSAPPFWQRFAKLFGCEHFSTYGIPCHGVLYICMLWLSPNDKANVLHTNTQNTYLPAHLHVY